MTELSIAFTKGEREDAVEVRSKERGPLRFSVHKKGPTPHDFVHLVVEQELGFARGFWGLIAAGVAPGEIQELAKAGGHASAKRAQEPHEEIVELLQAERLVECFEADSWGEPADFDSFRNVFAAACAASYVDAPALPDPKIGAVRARIAEFTKKWTAAPVGARFETSYSV